jgi:hypothetical protein
MLRSKTSWRREGRLTRTELALGAATFLAAAFAGFLSAEWVDGHYGAAAVRMPSATSSACVAEDGSWKNWIWANVPMLSPKCAGDR